jgi:hypothetical protein
LEIKTSMSQIKHSVESIINKIDKAKERIPRIEVKFENYYIQITIKKKKKEDTNR